MTPSDKLKETSLRYFLEVARCGSITEAAARLHVAASAVSRQIKNLEDTLQVQLLERLPRGVSLSAAGELLAMHARNVALDADRVVNDIVALQGLQRGRVKLACAEGFGIDFLPGLLAAFHQRHPGIHYELTVSSPAQVAELLLEGLVDIGLTFSRIAHKDLKVERRMDSPVMMIARPDHPLAGRSSVTLAQLAGYPLALPSRETSLRQVFDIACSRRGLVIEPLIASNSAPALHRFVLDSGAASIAGWVSVRGLVERGEMVAVPLREREMEARSIELQTLAGRTLPRVVRSCLDFILDGLARGT